MQSKEAKAFDLSQEPAASRAAYGSGTLRRGLPAGPPAGRGRRVRSSRSTLGGWDTHQNNFARVKTAVAARSTRPWPPWSTDLKERGLLDSTLVIWMGEFGRTPQHQHPRRQARPRPLPAGLEHASWSAAASRAARSIGKTDAEGATVVERPVTALDFMATVCQVLGIDYNKQNHDADRPADPHRRQGRQPDQGVARLRPESPSVYSSAHRTTANR